MGGRNINGETMTKKWITGKNPVARQVRQNPKFHQRVVKNKKKYSRKDKRGADKAPLDLSQKDVVL